jgi:predicted Zn-dependent protease
MLKKFATLIVSLLFIAIISCTISPGYTYSVVIDPTFSSEDKAAIIAGLNSWEHITDGAFSVASISYGACNTNDNQICFVPSNEAQIDMIRGSQIGDIIGFTYRTYSNDNSTIYIPLDRTVGFSPDTMTTIFAHEIGHALGLSHTQEGTVMCYEAGCDAPLPTCNDYQQWKDVRNITTDDFFCPKGGTYVLTGK